MSALPRWNVWFWPVWRLGVLVAIAAIMHSEHARRERAKIPGPTLEEAVRFFPQATSLGERDAARGGRIAYDSHGEPLGYLLHTAPEANAIVGYAGPNNALIALDGAGRVLGIELLASGDTDDHVDLVRRDEAFLARFRGWLPQSETPPKIDGVSGATLTSAAIAEGIELRLAGKATSLRFPDALTLDDVRPLFPQVDSLAAEHDRFRVHDSAGKLLGYVVRTSPAADNVSGYRGPSETLVALEADGTTLREIRLLKGYDTPDYMQTVRDDTYWNREVFHGKTTRQIADLDYTRDRIEGVSGATETSWAMAEGMKRRFAASSAVIAKKNAMTFALRDYASIAIVIGGVFLSFSKWRGNRTVRRVWQAILIGYVGFYAGDLLSIGLLVGWTKHGPPWNSAIGLTFIAAAALIVPLTTRRQTYCHQLCPHGAAQQWLGGIMKQKWTIPAKLETVLASNPYVLHGLALIVAMRGLPFDLAAIEPFDAWMWRAAGIATISIAVIGLIASMFVPQAYCRYGCPTGALLESVRSHGRADSFSRRDAWMLALLFSAFLLRPALWS